MREELTSELLKRYSELFKDDYFKIECGDGWFNLINVLCLELYSDYNSAKSLYDICLANSGQPMYPWIDASPIINDEMILDSHKEMCRRLNTLPKILQIKEKYGSLRIIAERLTSDQKSKLDFATLISTNICEQCGSSSPNEVQCLSSASIKTLCNTCRKI